MKITEKQQWALNLAIELDDAGYVSAATFLRQKHFPDVPWEKLATNINWIDLFRIHRGSLPPIIIENKDKVKHE